MPVQIATWNRARRVWETGHENMLCAHSVPYSATWPTSGSMRNGVAYERPTSARHIDGNGSSFSHGLPTPRARDWKQGGKDCLPSALLPTPRAQNGEDRNANIWARPSDQPQNLENALALLPTVRADMGGPCADSPDKHRLEQTIAILPTVRTTDANGGGNTAMADQIYEPSSESLLPTPTSNLGTNGGSQHPDKRKGHAIQLHDVIENL